MDTTKIIATIEQYNEVPRSVISTNLRRLLEPYKAADVAQSLGIATQTIYGWTKKEYGNKPTFEMAMKLCKFFNVNLAELIRDVDVSNIHDDRPMCETEGCPNRAGATKTLCHKCYRAKLRAEQKAKQATK